MLQMNDHIDVNPQKLLGLIASTLDRLFFGEEKAVAKKLYRQLRDGNAPQVMRLDAGEHGDLNCRLSLDTTECSARPGFAVFRQVLAAHLQAVAKRLEEGEGPNVYTSDASSEMIFNIPGAIEYNEQVYVLVTGVQQTQPGVLTFKLQFLDPAQFAKSG